MYILIGSRSIRLERASGALLRPLPSTTRPSQNIVHLLTYILHIFIAMFEHEGIGKGTT